MATDTSKLYARSGSKISWHVVQSDAETVTIQSRAGTTTKVIPLKTFLKNYKEV